MTIFVKITIGLKAIVNIGCRIYLELSLWQYVAPGGSHLKVMHILPYLSITFKPTQMEIPYIFISHSSKDKQIADAICHYLEEHGIACWIAPRDVLPGNTWAASIVKALRGCTAMVLIYSKNSNSSDQVINEVDKAFSNNKMIIPFMMDETPFNDDFDYYLSRKHWLKAFPDYRKMFEPLLKAVKQIYPKQASATETTESAQPEVNEKKETNIDSPIPNNMVAETNKPEAILKDNVKPVSANTFVVETIQEKTVEAITPKPIAQTVSWATNATENQKTIIQKIIDNMLFVEGGEMMLGATPEQSDMAKKDENPPHKVKLSSYLINRYPVTQEEWEAIMNNNPSKYKGAKRPIEKVSFLDAQKFIEELKRLSGISFALPSEAQWEFAARGGMKSKGYVYSGSNDPKEVAWINISETKAVGIKNPNELGLYDMSGNIGEWCDDEKGKYTTDFIMDPQYSYKASFWASGDKVI